MTDDAEVIAKVIEIERRGGYVAPDDGRKARELEAKGWKVWLRTVFPFAFPAEFASFHCEFWDKWWLVCTLIKEGKPVPDELLNFLLLWGRALAKSSSGTPSSLMKAAFAGRIYSIYLSETIDQATSHLANVRYLITHPESRLTEFYPHLTLEPTIPTSLGLKAKDTENVFITKGGSIFRALGIESAARGLILGGKRPDDFNIDDIDDITHGLMVSQKHLGKLTRSILLTRDIASGLVVTTKILQNLVIPHGVVNQIYTGKSDAFSKRTTIGPVNTFKTLEIESAINQQGRMAHTISRESVPSWEAVSIDKAQSILDLIGLDAFYAECQNKFDQFKSGKVIPEYSPELQRVSWSMFEQVFGQRRIPAHWNIKAGLDVGYSEGQYPHYSSWVFVAAASLNSKYAGLLFVYRSRFFKGTSIDDQAEIIKSEMLEGENVNSWQMSHERTGEMLTLRQKHQLPFGKFQFYKAEDGVAQWRHLSKPDKTKPHLFFDDDENIGTLEQPEYQYGRPTLYYIVDDDQLHRPYNDKGMMLLDQQISSWNYVTVKITESGQTQQKPSKINDDGCDSLKSVLALFGPQAAAKTRVELIEDAMPDKLKLDNITQTTLQDDQDYLYSRRVIEQQKIEKNIDAPVRVHRGIFARR